MMKNCSVRFSSSLKKVGNGEFVSVFVYKVFAKFRPKNSKVDVFSFYEVITTDSVLNISQDLISEKLFLIEINTKKFLVPLVDIFEHN